MTVRDVFELRRQGKTEEAYEAIRPMYAVHQGHYTTIAMFWTASDMLKLRLEQKRTDEAARIFQALCRLYPNLDDGDGRGGTAMLHHGLRLKDVMAGFSMLDFLTEWGIERLTPADWAPGAANDHPLPSTAQRLIACVHQELEDTPTPEQALRVVPILQEALRYGRNNMNYLRLMALVHRIGGDREKAAAIYKQLLQRHHQSYLYNELAALVEQPAEQVALMAKAILTQREERFRTKLHIRMAELLETVAPERAAYELNESIRIRQSGGFHLSSQQQQMAARLKGIVPVKALAQRQFYLEQAARVDRIVSG